MYSSCVTLAHFPDLKKKKIDARTESSRNRGGKLFLLDLAKWTFKFCDVFFIPYKF